MIKARLFSTRVDAKLRLISTRIDVKSEVRENIVALLNQQLADTFDLYSQTKQAHWNVKGMQFFKLHELFDQLAEEVEEHVDALAKRVTALGGTALGTARRVAAASRLPEYPSEAITGTQHLEALTIRYSALAATTRSAMDTAGQVGEADTADLFTEISLRLNQVLSFLKSHIQE